MLVPPNRIYLLQFYSISQMFQFCKTHLENWHRNLQEHFPCTFNKDLLKRYQESGPRNSRNSFPGLFERIWKENVRGFSRELQKHFPVGLNNELLKKCPIWPRELQSIFMVLNWDLIKEICKGAGQGNSGSILHWVNILANNKITLAR